MFLVFSRLQRKNQFFCNFFYFHNAFGILTAYEYSLLILKVLRSKSDQNELFIYQ